MMMLPAALTTVAIISPGPKRCTESSQVFATDLGKGFGVGTVRVQGAFLSISVDAVGLIFSGRDHYLISVSIDDATPTIVTGDLLQDADTGRSMEILLPK